MTTREFIELKLRGKTRKQYCSSVVALSGNYDGDATIYSYGYHYPLVRIVNGVGVVNSRGYSNTTGRHIRWAYQAAANIVGYSNTFGVPLTDGDKLDEEGIRSSAKREKARLEQLMASKKRHDTWVYSQLLQKHSDISGLLARLETA
jgi:hypothetical protein